MCSLTVQAILGIVTGIVTAAILFLCKALWDSKFHPFLRELRYGGVRIDGKWLGEGTDPDGDWNTELLLILNQSAFDLSGSFNLKHKSSKNSYELFFDVKGRIWEGYVVLNLTPVDRRITSFATAMFKIDGGGAGLVGQMVYRNVFAESVTAESVMLNREK